MATKQTQGRKIIAALKRKPHTYMEMLAYGWSISPWKRAVEGLAEHEAIVKGKRDGLTTWRVISATRWTA